MSTVLKKKSDQFFTLESMKLALLLINEENVITIRSKKSKVGLGRQKQTTDLGRLLTLTSGKFADQLQQKLVRATDNESSATSAWKFLSRKSRNDQSHTESNPNI